jgi:hypothetical protein
VVPLGALLRSRHLRSKTFPERKGRGDAGHSLLDSWHHVMLEHWSSGRHYGYRLFRMLRKDGYRGSYPTRTTFSACARRKRPRWSTSRPNNRRRCWLQHLGRC